MNKCVEVARVSAQGDCKGEDVTLVTLYSERQQRPWQCYLAMFDGIHRLFLAHLSAAKHYLGVRVDSARSWLGAREEARDAEPPRPLGYDQFGLDDCPATAV